MLDIDYSKRLLNEDLTLSEVIELDKKQKTEILNKPVKATKREDLSGKLPNNLEATYRAICEDNNATNQEESFGENKGRYYKLKK